MVSKIETNEIIDEYEPTEEGLDRVTVKKNLVVLEITLSADQNWINDNKHNIGY